MAISLGLEETIMSRSRPCQVWVLLRIQSRSNKETDVYGVGRSGVD